MIDSQCCDRKISAVVGIEHSLLPRVNANDARPAVGVVNTGGVAALTQRRTMSGYERKAVSHFADKRTSLEPLSHAPRGKERFMSPITLGSLLRVACVSLVLVSVKSEIFSAQEQDLPQLLDKLMSKEWLERASAAGKLLKTPDALQSADVRTALFDLLDRENRVIEDSFRRGVGSSNEYGESYGGYYAALLGKLSEVADYKDKRTLEIFARASYNRDSPFARKLAESGQPIVPIALELLKGDLGWKREHAIAILGMVYERRQVHRLPEESVELIKQTIVTTATKDSDSVTRQTAVEILGRTGTASDLPLLQRIAATDPATYKRGETRRYNVREAAVGAIAAIRKRTGPK